LKTWFVFITALFVVCDASQAYEKIHVELPSDDSVLGEPIRLDFYKNGSDKRPLVLVGEILGGNDSITNLFAPKFAKKGFQVLVVHTPEVLKVVQEIHTFDDLVLLKKLIQATLHSYQAGLNWARKRGEVDENRIGVFGISLGAMLTSYLMASDQKIAAGYFALTGSNSAGILAHSTEPMLVKLRRHVWDNEFPGNHDTRKEVEHDFEKRFQALELPDLKQAVSTDTTRLSQGAFMVYAQFDKVIPVRYAKEQWELMGRPKIVKLLGVGHYRGSILYAPWVQKSAIRWFKTELKID